MLEQIKIIEKHKIETNDFFLNNVKNTTFAPEIFDEKNIYSVLREGNMNSMTEILNTYNSITLDEIQRVKLMKRIDTKFIIEEKKLFSLLPLLTDFYEIMEINGVKNLRYNTFYYDTPNFEMYLLHHNGKKNRHKIRVREYIDSKTNFLEVKFKNNKRQTIKNRIPIDELEIKNDDYIRNFLLKYSGYRYEEIEKKTTNSFKRITLANKKLMERVTIDTDISFKTEGKPRVSLNNFCIIEIKQEKFNINSEFMQLLKQNSIRPMRVSKYCTGTILLNPEIKSNRFKRKILTINKLTA